MAVFHEQDKLASVGLIGGGSGSSSAETYKGDYNAFANTPDLKKTGTIVSTATVGDFYIVTVAGTQDLGGGSKEYGKGDKAKFNGSFFDKEDVVIPDGNQIVLDKTNPASPTVTQAINSKASSTDLTQEVQARQTADAGLQTEINGKANLVSGAVANHLLITNANGQPQNSGYRISETLDSTTDNIPTSKAIDKGVATDVVTIKPSEGIGNNKTAPLYFSGMDNSQAFISYLSNLSGSNNKVYFGVKKASNPNVDALVLDLTPKKALLFGSYIATISNLTLRYDNNNFSYYTNQILVDQSTGDRAIVKQNFTSSTSTTFQDLINSNKIAIIPLGSRTPYPTLDNPDQNPLYNNANGFSVDSKIEYDGQVWVYISENAEGIPSWVIKEDVVNVSRSFGLVDEYANGTIIIVSNAIGMPNADYSANPIPANLFAKSFKANYIINDSQPVFDILDSNGNLVNQLPLEYLSSSENPIKNDDDLLLSNHNLGCTNQGDLNDALTSAITNKADKVANATAGHLASLDVNGNLADSGITASNVTTQGNSFNGENQLVKLNGSGKVPASTIPTTLTDLAEAGNNISLTLNPATGKYGISSTGSGVASQSNVKWVNYIAGNDTNSGSITSPLKSVVKANQLITNYPAIIYNTSPQYEIVDISGQIFPEIPSVGLDAENKKTVTANRIIKWGLINQTLVTMQAENTSNIHIYGRIYLRSGGAYAKFVGGATITNQGTFTNGIANLPPFIIHNVNGNYGTLAMFDKHQFGTNASNYIEFLTDAGGKTNIADARVVFNDCDFSKSPVGWLDVPDNSNALGLTIDIKNQKEIMLIGKIGTGNILKLDNSTGVYFVAERPTASQLQTSKRVINANEPFIFRDFIKTQAQLDLIKNSTNSTYLGVWKLNFANPNTAIAGVQPRLTGWQNGDFVVKLAPRIGIACLPAETISLPISFNSGEISMLPAKTTLSANDVLLIEDSASGNVKAKTTIAALIASTISVGTIMPFYGTTAPAGFLMLNGSTIVGGKTTYSTLWAFAVADNSTTTDMLLPQLFVSLNATDFKIPDFRGYFLRGLGGVDPDVATRTLGSVQADEFTSHGHVYISGRTFPGVNAGNGGYFGARYENDTSTTSSVGGAETRPKNIAMNFIIKF